MHEIEIKAALRNPEEVLGKLEALGCVFSEPVTQDDTVYVKNVGSMEEYVANTLFLRIRVQNNGKILFTVKHHEGRVANDPTGTPVEHELEISSRDTMIEMLTLFGFQEAVRITKSRRKAKYQEWELCLDEVEGLGSFLEIEQMGTFADAEAAQKDMVEFMLSLGIYPTNIPAQRYDIAMLEKCRCNTKNYKV